MPEIAVGALGSVAGGVTASKLSGGNGKIDMSNYYSTPSFVNTMNDMLQNALTQATQTQQNYTNQAINQQNTSLGQANQALQSGLTSANLAAQQALASGVNQYRQVNAPYAQTSYNALDALNDSLGLSRPTMGSGAIANALFNQSQLQGMAKPGQAPVAPVNPTLESMKPTQQQIQDYINQNTSTSSNGTAYYTGQGGAITGNGPGSWNSGDIIASGNPWIQQAASQAVQQNLFQQAQKDYQNQLQTYNQQAPLYNSYAQQYNNIAQQFTPQQQAIAQAYQQGLFTK